VNTPSKSNAMAVIAARLGVFMISAGSATRGV
jgi:hypothetical protein